MENVTVGQIASIIATIVAIGGGVAVIVGWISKSLKKYLTVVIKEEIEPLKTSVNKIEKDVQMVDKQACKNYLVSFLSDVEQGGYIDEIETQRFWEQYEHYEKQGGNSYIHQKVEKLKAKNLL